MELISLLSAALWPCRPLLLLTDSRTGCYCYWRLAVMLICVRSVGDYDVCNLTGYFAFVGITVSLFLLLLWEFASLVLISHLIDISVPQLSARNSEPSLLLLFMELYLFDLRRHSNLSN